MTILEIIQLCIIGAAVLAVFVYIIVMAIKNKWLQKIMETIKTSIAEAEKKFPESGSGDKKKQFVIDVVKAKCDELGIPYALLGKLINKLIERIVGNYNIISKSDSKK